MSTLMRIPILSEILSIPVAMIWFIGLVGYTTWYIGALFFEKEHPRVKDSWYGFTEFKQQHLMSALIGAIATILCFIIPTMVPITAGLFFISNVFWSISAIHENNTPHPNDLEYSTDQQTIYTYFAINVTLLSLVTAIASIVSILFPLADPVFFSIASILGGGLSVTTFGWMALFLGGTYETDVSKQARLDPNLSPPASVQSPQSSTISEPNCWAQYMPTCFGSPIHTIPKEPPPPQSETCHRPEI